MAFAAAAVSGGIDALTALLSPSKTKPKSGFSGANAGFNIGGAAATGPEPANTLPTQSLSPETFNAAISAQSASTDKSAALKSLFRALDTNGDGQIAKSEFETNLGAGGTNTANATKVFGKIDSNGDGSVSLEELTSALATKKKRDKKPGEDGGEDVLLKALKGGSSSSSVNGDGSSTTTVTYADGTKVTLTKPASASASLSATSSYNFVERAIQQARYLSASASNSLSVSV